MWYLVMAGIDALTLLEYSRWKKEVEMSNVSPDPAVYAIYLRRPSDE